MRVGFQRIACRSTPIPTCTHPLAPCRPTGARRYRSCSTVGRAELVFQKSLNTISKRHHVRIWHAGTYAGKDVWLGAATHDTGVDLWPMAVEFRHKIDPEIDTERSKIVDDLLFAGCSQSVGYIDPRSASNQDHDISTDQRLAVLFIGSCYRRSGLPGVNGMKGPGSWMVRLSRRLILLTRNYLVREQPYYWAYEMVRWGHSTFSGAPTYRARRPAAARRCPHAKCGRTL